MNGNQRLEVVIHMLDGSEFRYGTEDREEVDRILKSIQPNRLFSQKQLLIAGSYFMAGFTSDEVTRVDLIADELPEWNLPAGFKEFLEVAEESIDRRAMPRVSDQKRSEFNPAPGSLLEVFAEFGIADGKRIGVVMHLQSQGAIDQRTQLTQLFNQPSFYINRREGGVIIVHTRHINRWIMYPGPAATPPTAWQMHRLDSREWGGGPSLMVKKLEAVVSEVHAEEEEIGEEKLAPGNANFVEVPTSFQMGARMVRADINLAESNPPRPPSQSSDAHREAATAEVPTLDELEETASPPGTATPPKAQAIPPTSPIDKGSKRRVLKFGKKE